MWLARAEDQPGAGAARQPGRASGTRGLLARAERGADPSGTPGRAGRRPGRAGAVCWKSEGESGREPGAAAAVWAQLAEPGGAARSAQPGARHRAPGSGWRRLQPTTDGAGRAGPAGALRSPTRRRRRPGWSSRLGMTEGEARSEVTLRLAEAYLAAGQRHRAHRLPRPHARRVPRGREAARRCWWIFIAAARPGSRWRACWPRAATTSRTRPSGSSGRAARSSCTRSSGLLARAVPLLEKLVQPAAARRGLPLGAGRGAVPERSLRRRARACCCTLIEEAGWRRSRKRATLHHRLAGGGPGWRATCPSRSNTWSRPPRWTSPTGRSCSSWPRWPEPSGADERAERAYRALLVLRRQDGPAPGQPPARLQMRRARRVRWPPPRSCCACTIWPASAARAEQAAELMESALTAAIADAAEAQRLQRALLERGEHGAARSPVREAPRPRRPDAGARRRCTPSGRKSCAPQGRPAEALEAQLPRDRGRPRARPTCRPRPRSSWRAARARSRPWWIGWWPCADGLRRAARRAGERGAAAAGGPAGRDRSGRSRPRAGALPAGRGDPGPRRWRCWERAGSHRAASAVTPPKRERLVGLLKQRAADGRQPRRGGRCPLPGRGAGAGRAPRPARPGIASLCQAVEKGPISDVERALELVARGRPAAGGAGEDPAALRAGGPAIGRRARCCSTTSSAAAPTPRSPWRRSVRRSTWRWPSAARERVEPLLLASGRGGRAETGPSGRDEASATWALLELVQRQKAAGDLRGGRARPWNEWPIGSTPSGCCR